MTDSRGCEHECTKVETASNRLNGVADSEGATEYTLLDLVTHKEKLYHMTQLKPFHFDPTHVDPTDIARRDYLEFFIEETLDMKGNIRAYKSLTFHVKWLNYTHEHNTWEL